MKKLLLIGVLQLSNLTPNPFKEGAKHVYTSWQAVHPAAKNAIKYGAITTPIVCAHKYLHNLVDTPVKEHLDKMSGLSEILMYVDEKSCSPETNLVIKSTHKNMPLAKRALKEADITPENVKIITMPTGIEALDNNISTLNLLGQDYMVLGINYVKKLNLSENEMLAVAGHEAVHIKNHDTKNFDLISKYTFGSILLGQNSILNKIPNRMARVLMKTLSIPVASINSGLLSLGYLYRAEVLADIESCKSRNNTRDLISAFKKGEGVCVKPAGIAKYLDPHQSFENRIKYLENLDIKKEV